MITTPYLSPPMEFRTLVDDVSMKSACTTIDPQKLSATSDERPMQSKGVHEADNMAIKTEMDEDYGFSRFAAERDALRNEDELDEDTKLLMSEEGRKLSSKERRQLRNKVSARNFRERRKEYITHLETLVNKHQTEATMYKSQVDVLTSEKDELAAELAKLKISINVALESNKLVQQQQQQGNLSSTSLTRSYSRSDTPTKEASLIPNLTKDIYPYSTSSNFNVDWPLSNMASPSGGSFDFNLHNYTSVFSMRPDLPQTTFSEKELLGKDRSSLLAESSQPSECLDAFDRVLCSILGNNWKATASMTQESS